MYFATGGKILAISDDWKRVSLRLKLNFWTRNYVGTIFGGSLFSASDPFYMIMFMNILGKNDYVVWDRGASIKFIKPGKETLYANLEINDQIINEVKSQVDKNGFYIWTMPLTWTTKDGKAVCYVERQIYAATKDYYFSKKS
jgi:hypothetical protein